MKILLFGIDPEGYTTKLLEKEKEIRVEGVPQFLDFMEALQRKTAGVVVCMEENDAGRNALLATRKTHPLAPFIQISWKNDARLAREAFHNGVADYILREEIETELLPAIRRVLGKTVIAMCYRCQKVRDERGSWHKIPDYLAREFGTCITHTLCPSDLQKEREAAGLPAST